MFQPKVFAELQNAQAIVLPYDGLNPQPPTYCYLKPYYLDVADQLLRSRRDGSALNELRPHPAVPPADRAPDPGPGRHRDHGERLAARLRRARRRRRRRSTACSIDERNLKVAVKNIARALGDDVSEEKPILDSRLPDGSRVAAVFPPCSLGGTTLTIRKFQTRFFTADELVRIGTMITGGARDSCASAIASRREHPDQRRHQHRQDDAAERARRPFPADDRIVLIEDTAELQIDAPNLVRFEARRERGALPAVTIRDLLRATLRHRPDRIIVGEVRGGEAFDLLQALNTGHAGTLSTIHANSAEQALSRFASCVLQSGVELPYPAVRRQIGDAIDVVVHLERRHGLRRVADVLRRSGLRRSKRVVRHACAASRECGRLSVPKGESMDSRSRRLSTIYRRGVRRARRKADARRDSRGTEDGGRLQGEPPLRMLRFPAVRDRTGLSRSTIWRLEQHGSFPRHRRISANAVAWLEEEVVAWIRCKCRA